MVNSQNPERDAKIVSLATNPPYLTLAEISKQLDKISPERVRQILTDNMVDIDKCVKLRHEYGIKIKQERMSGKLRALIRDKKSTIELVFRLYAIDRLSPAKLVAELGISRELFNKHILPFLPFPIHEHLPDWEAQMITESMEQGITLKEYVFKMYIEDDLTLMDVMKRYEMKTPVSLCRFLGRLEIRKRPHKAKKNSHIENLNIFMASKGYSKTDRKQFLLDHAIVPNSQLARLIGIPYHSIHEYYRISKVKKTYPPNWTKKDEHLFTDSEIQTLNSEELNALAQERTTQKLPKT